MKRILLPLVGISVAVSAWITSDGGFGLYDLFWIEGTTVVLGLAWLTVLLRRYIRSKSVRSCFDLPTFLAAILLVTGVGIAWYEAAFPLRFALSRSSLDQYARSFSSNDEVPQPKQIGLFRIKEAETLEGGVVRLITAECMVDDCGLTYSPFREPPVVGEDSYSKITEDWYRWERSW